MKSRPATFAVMGLALGALVVLLVVSILQTRALTGQIRQSQKTNTGTVRLIKAQGRAIQDCTDPSGECFKRGQERAAAFGVDINEGTLRVIVAALTCQDLGYTDAALAACTTRRITKP